MKQKFLLASGLFLFFLTASRAQGLEAPIAIGVNYERIKDVNNLDNTFTGKGVQVDYGTRRERFSVDVLYGLSPRLKIESGVGVSIYSSDVQLSAVTSYVSTHAGIRSANVVVSQKVMFDLLYLPGLELSHYLYLQTFKNLRFTVSPYLELEYEQFLSKRNRFRGYADLFSEGATYDISVLDKPAVSATIKTPFGILSGIGGLSLEALIYNKIGLSYDIGYFRSLLGRTTVDGKYRYKGNDIHTFNFKSENVGFMIKGRVRYYF